MSAKVEIPEDVDVPSSSLWAKLPMIGLIVGAAGLAGAFATWGSNKQHILHSYLFAYMAVLSIALGSLAFVLIQHVVRAGWSASIRRIAENAMVTLPVFALLFLPILLSTHDIFPWTHEEHLDAVLKAKAPYLNGTQFTIRAVIYFVVWGALSWLLYSKSVGQDSGKNVEKSTRVLWKLSTVGILLYGLSQTFAAFDWTMSLQPHWYSTIYGVYYFAGSMLAAFSFMTLVAMRLQSSGLIKTAITTEHYHDLGKWLFGFTVFWAYIGFSQFFLIWYANIPEETEFFMHRLHHGWGQISWAMPITHFFLPFFYLLSRHVKRHRAGLMIGAVYIFLMHIVDVYWLVMPTLSIGGEQMHMGDKIWIDICAFVGVFGVFLAVFGFFLNRNKLIAIGDPRLPESLVHENY